MITKSNSCFSNNVPYRRDKECRLGASAIEFAITAPILLLLVFGGLELSRANLLRNSCEYAALEGARRGIVPGASADQCIAQANENLDMIGVQEYEVFVDPPTILPDTEEVTVTVRIPLTENALPMSKFVLGMTMERSITLRREISIYSESGGGDNDN